MPNNVMNRLKMKGIANLPLYEIDNNGDKHFDFNKIIPMPEKLNITSGSLESKSIKAFISEIVKNEKVPIISDNFLISQINEKELIKFSEQDFIELGRRYVNNICEYGYSSWYMWCLDNWGTKWNAYECKEIDEDTIEFQTAWASPLKVIETLSKSYPYDEIQIQWADEFVGYNSGTAIFIDGLLECDSYENDTIEAVTLYTELWDDYDNESQSIDKLVSPIEYIGIENSY